MSRRKLGLMVVVAILMLVLVACTPGTNPAVGVPDEGGHVDGFWAGLWHGMISPITFIISLFNANINVYEVHNNGNWYDFGFVLGAGILFGGSSSASRRS